MVSWWKAEGNAIDSAGLNNGKFNPPAGMVLSQIVTLTVTPPTLLVNPTVSGGQFHASVTGNAGDTNRIEVSSDLATWTPLITNTIPFAFTDSATGGRKFYRAVKQ